MDTKELIALKVKWRERVLALEGVVGIGVGYNTIRVYIEDELYSKNVPPYIEDVPTELIILEGPILAEEIQ